VVKTLAFFVCGGALSLSRGRVCHVIGHSPSVCQSIRTYVDFNIYKHLCFKFFSFFFLRSKYDVTAGQACNLRFCTEDNA
jgi:hypothetical protein